MSSQTRVWVLSISHRHGVHISDHSTRAKAEDALLSYVEDWWERELGPTPLGEDVVADYFQSVDESYDITECMVD